jgi:hypothetical protein
VNDIIKWLARTLEEMIECLLLSQVRDIFKLNILFPVWVGFIDSLGFVFRPNRGGNRITTLFDGFISLFYSSRNILLVSIGTYFHQIIKYMGRHKAIASGEKDTFALADVLRRTACHVT